MTAVAPATVDTLLCDADGNLFASEEPAFDASVIITNRLMAELGVERRFTAHELRLATTGKNFRTTAADLAAEAGAPLDQATLERWVDEERREVTAHLASVLRPDPEVVEPVRRLARRFRLAAVSSSALGRLDASFSASGLNDLFPPELRFSAEDSLAVPTSKPDPAIYRFAAERLGVDATRAVAIEDAVPGARSAVGAGLTTIGNVAFVPPGERDERVAALEDAGVAAVVGSWTELEELLRPVAAAARQ